MARELVAIIKHDCPVCVELLPALDAAAVSGAPLRIVSQSDGGDTSALWERLGLGARVELDEELALSDRLDLDAVPAVVLLDGGEERGRVEGLARDRLAELAAEAGVTLRLDGLPAHRPGCASRTRDPLIAATLAVRAARAQGRLRSRPLVLGAHEDPFEALHDRGLTDGLPVVPPTPERVVAMLEGTRRDSQEVVGVVPPYGGAATVEKVAINAVMAGCRPEHLPFALAAVEAACVESFTMHGLLATTHPAGPLIVASGPLTERAGMNARGNCLGQGNRANLAIGRTLQLVVRNIGGGRPQIEDRSAHGQPGKVGACFAELLEASPWEPLSVDRGFGAGDTTVTLWAAESPRFIWEQLARTPEGLCASIALALQGV
ncbi:MAG TPA: thioredoxin family protein, partial [Candidatus Dormibacteraeota bacterium]|nr:thioredoxin family protein [Candidatus Dormibacteraeota bacterium]